MILYQPNAVFEVHLKETRRSTSVYQNRKFSDPERNGGVDVAASDTQRSTSEFPTLRNSYLQALKAGQRDQAESIIAAIDRNFQSLHGDISMVRELQEMVLEMSGELQRKTNQIVQLQIQIANDQTDILQLQRNLYENQNETNRLIIENESLNRHMQESILDNQEKILELQKEALSNLSVIQGRVQAVLTQAYELHEYPIPRLFIVLPRQVRSGNIFVKKFRLFFLCECGVHTMHERSKAQHKIHLAKHEGYDIRQPTEFFKKYGTYLLTMMQLFKYGIIVAGIAVPAIAHFDISQVINPIQEFLKESGRDIRSLVDDSISYLDSRLNSSDNNIDTSQSQSTYDSLEPLEGADLRKLESFLNVKDTGRVLGNLYRIVTAQGHVKWVCNDHYRENYNETKMELLWNFIERNNGGFNKERGKINIALTSNSLAEEFYSLIINARGVQELEVLIEWNASKDELNEFEKAISKANVVHLTFSGSQPLVSRFDALNPRDRYEPLVRLMSNNRVQTFQIKNLPNFFEKEKASFITEHSQLRRLAIDTLIDSEQNNSILFISKIVESCNSLVSLQLATKEPLKLCRLFVKFDRLALKTIITKPIKPLGKWAIILKFSRSADSGRPKLKFGEDSDSRNCGLEVALTVSTDSILGPRMHDFYGEYGNHFETLDTGLVYSKEAIQHFANPIRKHGSKLTRICMDTTHMSASSLDSLVHILDLSCMLEIFDVVIDDIGQDCKSKIGDIIKKYAGRLNKLEVKNDEALGWFSKKFTSRQEFPNLETIKLSHPQSDVMDNHGNNLDENITQWIVAFLADRDHFARRKSSTASALAVVLQQSKPAQSPKPLKVFVIERINFRPKNWKAIIDSLNFFGLQGVIFNHSNFNSTEMISLIDRISCHIKDHSEISLKSLDVSHTVFSILKDESLLSEIANHIQITA
ncbi:hypothetical protein BGZ76_009611 [Entomortierella beljakovae]|nr:hypothetical protein BGZ76_009611 [Entomortierella beljakovae]